MPGRRAATEDAGELVLPGQHWAVQATDGGVQAARCGAVGLSARSELSCRMIRSCCACHPEVCTPGVSAKQAQSFAWHSKRWYGVPGSFPLRRLSGTHICRWSFTTLQPSSDRMQRSQTCRHRVSPGQNRARSLHQPWQHHLPAHQLQLGHSSHRPHSRHSSKRSRGCCEGGSAQLSGMSLRSRLRSSAR